MIDYLRKLFLFLIIYYLSEANILAQICISPGKDGPPTTTAAQVNTYYPGSGSVSIGATSITLGTSRGSTTPINKGDLVLIIQMQGADINAINSDAYGSGGTSGSGNINNTNFTAGNYEYAIATNNVATSGGTLTISSGIDKAYSTANYGTTGQRRFQVIRVPQYSGITLTAGITALSWNGSTGGVVAMDVAGQLNFNGQTINAAGAGFRGGAGRALRGPGPTGALNTDYRTLSTQGINAQKGEGTAGTPANVLDNNALLNTNAEGYVNGSMGRGAPGNAGGGGTDGNSAVNDQNTGGGGGANGGTGGKGGNSWNSNLSVGGIGGNSFGTGTSWLLLGGGGGAGSTNDATGNLPNGLASSGAAGGGIVIVRAGTIVGTGSILANGGNANNSVANDGSGGGGAGGSVILTVASGSLTGITVNATGGTGGTNTGGGAPHGPGGGGGGGVIYASSALASGSSMAGGLNGTTVNTSTPYGATAGTSGILNTAITNSQISTVPAGATCLPILAVTKATTTPTVYRLTSGTQATYSITVSNTGGAAHGVRISDVLPANFTFNSTVVVNTGTINGSFSNNLGSYDDAGTTAAKAPVLTTGSASITPPTIGSTAAVWGSFYIPSGVFVRVTYRVDIDASVPANTTIQNAASASYLDPTRTTFARLVTMDAVATESFKVYETGAGAGADVPGSNYASSSSTGEDVVVKLPVDVQVTNTVSAAPYFVGQNVTYTITAKNNSTTDNATGVVVTDNLPAGLTFVSATPNSAYNATTGAWTIGTLTPGATVTLTLIATPNTAGNITTTANKTQNEPDEITNNNTASNTITVATPADVAVTTTVAAGPYYNGVNTTFTITVTNNGPNTATGINIQEQIPAGLELVDNTPGVGTSYTNGNWTINNLDNAASATLTLLVKPKATGSLTITSTKTAANEYDNVAGNNTSSASISVNPNAEVAVVNTVANGPYYRGIATTYTVTVTNNGPDDATGLQVKDLLPTTLDYKNSTPAANTTYDNTTGFWTIGSLTKGSSKTLTISAAPNTTNAITTIASITAQTQYDQNNGNNSSSNTIYPNAAADIAITNTVAAGPYYNGVNTTFTVTAKNNGPSNASNVKVTDLLPAGLQLVNADPSNGTYNSATGVWDIGNLLATNQATLKLTVKPTTTGTLSTTASKSNATGFDNVSSNDQAAASINVIANADLAVTNTVSPLPHVVGTDVTYTVTVKNNGPDATTGVIITDQLPAGLDYKSNTTNQGNAVYDPISHLITWNVGALASGQTQTLTLLAAPNTNTVITTIASVSGSNVYDSQKSNNTSSNSIDVDAAPVADIAITNTAAGGTYYNNVQTTFTVTAKNNGPDAASGVQISDLLPAGLTFINADPSIGTYDATTGVWDIGNITNGDTQTLILTVKPNTTGDLITRAETSAIFENDYETANNFDEEIITVLANAEVEMVLMVTEGPFLVGDYPVFSAKIRNNGPNTATNVRVFDNRPVTFDLATFAGTPSTGTYSMQTGYWDIPSLASGEEATISFTGKVIRSGTISLRVSKTSQTEFDNNAANNEDLSSIVVNPSANMEVTNTVSPAPYTNGAEVTYTISAKNLGPSPASGVKITDQLPAGLAFVRYTATTGTYNENDGVWNIDNIALNQTQTLTLVAKPTQTGTFVTTAAKTAQNETDIVSTNNAATNEITVGSSADVVGKFSVSPGPYYNGITPTTFTGTVTNNGPDAATGLFYYDNRPSSLNFSIRGASANYGTYNPATGYWDIGTLPVGATATLTVQTVPIKTGNITINASKTGQTNSDPVPANDNASVTVNVQKAADIALSSVQSSGPYFVNQETSFTITATNNGADDATSVAVTHELPAGLAYVSANPSVGSYNSSTGIWTIGDLPKTTPATITFTVRPATTGQFIVQSVKSAGSEYDVNTSNNTVITEFNNVMVHQPAVYTVAPPKNVDAYINGESLATVTDPDGPITAATIISGALPAGVAFNTSSGTFTVADNTLLVAGSYTLIVKTTDAIGGQTELPVTLVFLPDTEAGATVFTAKNFYDYRNNDILASFTDDDGPVVQTTLISGSLPTGVSMPDGHIIASNQLLIRPGSYTVTVRTLDQTGGISMITVTLEITQDRDGDGISDFQDLDNNNDGITDIVSGYNFNPYGDADGDGNFNYYDTDFLHAKYGAFRDKNGDGINDWFDIDLDGIINSLDLDMDGDGIANTREAYGGFAPPNYNTTISKFNGGEGVNGMPDEAETSPESGITNLPMPDSDGDSFKDFLDIDADNDGISDNIEAQTTAGYQAPSNIDADRDGLVSNYDGNENGQALIPVNTDGAYAVSDAIPDYLDLNSDNDKSFDYYEAFDDNNDKVALDNLLQRAQAYEAAANKRYYLNQDINSFQDSDTVPDWLESQNNRPNFLSFNSAYYHDTDQDGMVDLFDADNSGVVVNPSKAGNEADFRSEEVVVPLPVEIIRFAATQKNTKVQLTWATASEQNNDFFSIERSSDGKTFITLGQVKGAGTSNQLLEYQFIDNNPLPKIAYYRLQQVDFNGSSKYSKIIWVETKADKTSTANLYPNPVNNKATVEFTATSNARHIIRIVDAQGRQVRMLTVQTIIGLNKIVLNLPDLASGRYILMLEGSATQITIPFIKN